MSFQAFPSLILWVNTNLVPSGPLLCPLEHKQHPGWHTPTQKAFEPKPSNSDSRCNKVSTAPERLRERQCSHRSAE